MPGEVDPRELISVAHAQIRHSGRGAITPAPHQIPPPDEDESWETFLMLGGRGIGKTFAGAYDAIKHLRKYGPEARYGIMAPTNKDARSICAEGRSGLITLFRDEFSEEYGGKYLRTTGEAWHRDGGFVQIKGAQEIESWRGPSWSRLWVDEYAICEEEAVDNAIFGLRDGEHPKLFVTTTPRPIQRLKDLAAAEGTVVSRLTTLDAEFLPEAYIKRLLARYPPGSRLYRQEILGEILDQEEGALWDHERIERYRIRLEPPEVKELARSMERIVVSIDPAVTANKDSDYTAISVTGVLGDDYYVFELFDMKVSPGAWARRGLNLYMEYEADAIIGERNNGGDLVEHVIRNECREMIREGLWSGPEANVRTVVASRGKITRAEPVAALAEQGRVHHVGVFDRAEAQMCTYPITVENDDLVDAHVWGVSELNTRLRHPVVIPVNFSKRSTWKSIDREIAV